ncbi:hypothetical protein TrST_g11622 [Triparma strigata]|uniref:Uncharacterized protein n=1 Tax=Triparma strigata TaxID=1606541 RepID=A0A9W7EQ33_9STRA|nr:hypothetical protein TrST_g11622 [Triparma strigata]|mmetsp:Transcript_21847/g.41118  ORF Transcript_21847/g.41118 Transcript_21847/m.41118 type:complete len:109 (+) Transcript_21847:137-463(+)
MPSPHHKVEFFHPRTEAGFPSPLQEELTARAALPKDWVEQAIFDSPGHAHKKGRAIQGKLKSKPLLISSGVADLIGKPARTPFKKHQERKRSVSSGDRGRTRSMTKII